MNGKSKNGIQQAAPRHACYRDGTSGAADPLWLIPRTLPKPIIQIEKDNLLNLR